MPWTPDSSRPATPTKQRRQFHTLEGQKNEFYFYCAFAPGINVHKAYNGDTGNLDDREELMFKNYGMKVTYIVELGRKEFIRQKYAHRAKRTVTKGEAVKQIAQVIFMAVRAEYMKSDEWSRAALKELKLMSLIRVGQASFMCKLEREADVSSHSSVPNNPPSPYAQPSDYPQGNTAHYPAHPSPASATTRNSPLPHFSHGPLSLDERSIRRGTVSIQTRDIAEVYAQTIQQESPLTTYPSSESESGITENPATHMTTRHRHARHAPYPYPSHRRRRSLAQDNGANVASYTSSAAPSSPTSLALDAHVGFNIDSNGQASPSNSSQTFGVRDASAYVNQQIAERLTLLRISEPTTGPSHSTTAGAELLSYDDITAPPPVFRASRGHSQMPSAERTFANPQPQKTNTPIVAPAISYIPSLPPTQSPTSNSTLDQFATTLYTFHTADNLPASLGMPADAQMITHQREYSGGEGIHDSPADGQDDRAMYGGIWDQFVQDLFDDDGAHTQDATVHRPYKYPVVQALFSAV